VQAHRARQRDDRRRDESDDDGACNGLLELLVVSGPVGARCDDGKAVADADAEADQKLVDGPAGPDGSKGGVTQHIAHDHGVHGVVELLEEARHQNGEHEDDEALEDGAVHQVHALAEKRFFCGGSGHKAVLLHNFRRLALSVSA